MADTKITALTALTAADPANDVIPIVDVSDTSMAASGTTKKISVNNILGASGTATLASATITGDLTVRTTGLTVNSSGVGVGTSSQSSFLGNSPKKLVIGDGTQTPALTLYGGTANVSGIYYAKGTVGNEAYRGFIEYNHAVDALTVGISGSTAMTLNSTGLGIGVTPSAWGAGGNIQGTNGFIWSSYDASIGAGYYYASSSYKYISTAAASIYSPFGGTHKWFTAAGGQPAGTNFTPTQAMTLDASGNLLVGRTTLFAQPSRFTVESNSQTTSICGIFNDARTDSASAINIAFYRNGIKVGSVDCTNTATSYVTSSDYRLKEDVQPLSGGLARVSALKPSIYKWKINGSNGEGFIAHELAEVVPAAVTGEKDAVNKDGTVNPQGVDLSKVVPILVAAIQELTARVQTLEAR